MSCLACALLAAASEAPSQAPAKPAQPVIPATAPLSPETEYPVRDAKELISALRSADPAAKKAAAAVMARADKAMVSQLLSYGGGGRREVGEKVVYRMGRKAVPALFELLDEETVAGGAAGMLFQLAGPEDMGRLPRLADCAASGRPGDYACAQTIFKLASPKAAPHAKAIGACLLRATEESRFYCAAALGRLGAGAAGALDDLITALGDEHSGVRAQAASALGGLGKGGAKAAPALKRATGDASPEVRRKAAAALRKVTGA